MALGATVYEVVNDSRVEGLQNRTKIEITSGSFESPELNQNIDTGSLENTNPGGCIVNFTLCPRIMLKPIIIRVKLKAQDDSSLTSSSNFCHYSPPPELLHRRKLP